uniref:Ell-associated factor Eaf n=1 Tax=Corethrella appendiculata TaxID=1370023 RepID=U5EQ04_9DIPT
MEDRLNLGSGVHELKLGSTFTNPSPKTIFHTMKYDFKPASVDVNKIAKLDVSSNNQVTVTVPHLDGSGVPNTVFKGNQRDYTKKECVLIINPVTGEITLEKLHSNIQVKKTRNEVTNKQIPHPPPQITSKLENNTARHSSKTKITTGVRKNTISFVPKHSPLPNSPNSYPHKSPQSAPAWNANNTQQTLPSIPMIDDMNDFMGAPSSSATSASSSQHHHHQQQVQQQQQINNHYLNNNSSSSSSNNINNIINDVINMPSSTSGLHHQQQQQQQQQQQDITSTYGGVGVLSSSDSSSDSESSDSGSESDSSDGDGSAMKTGNSSLTNQQQITNRIATHILNEDLCLSETNSESDD